MTHAKTNWIVWASSFILGAALTLSCSTLRSTIGAALDIFEDPQPQAATGGPMAYQRGVRHLEQDDFVGAITAFGESLEAEPTSAYSQVAIFNTGRALEGLGRWSEAEEKYRTVVRATARAPKLQTLALYRLSFCHEAQNNDSKTVAALMDVRSRAQYLPEEIAVAEMPARLAAAYARIGNVDEAIKYYAQGEAGIARLRNQAGVRAVPEWLPRTLYYMGRMSLRTISWNGFENALRPVGRAQLYLLQAAELEAGRWSRDATQELIRTYTEIWNVVEAPPEHDPGDDPLMARREAQDRQWALAELVLGSLRELKAARAPIETDRSVQVEEIFAFIGEMEKKLLSLLDQPLEGTGLTPEAKERREKIRGRVVRPNDSLERAYEKRRLKKALPKKQSPKNLTPESPTPENPESNSESNSKDPNL